MCFYCKRLILDWNSKPPPVATALAVSHLHAICSAYSKHEPLASLVASHLRVLWIYCFHTLIALLYWIVLFNNWTNAQAIWFTTALWSNVNGIPEWLSQRSVTNVSKSRKVWLMIDINWYNNIFHRTKLLYIYVIAICKQSTFHLSTTIYSLFTYHFRIHKTHSHI